VFNKLRFLTLLVIVAFITAIPAFGQTESRILLGALNISEFPKITAYLDVRGAQGFFISALPPTSATVFENEAPVPANITEVRPGAQIVLAYGGGENFGIFPVASQTRYTLLAEWIRNWVASKPDTALDDLSMIIPEGMLVSHQTDPAVLLEALVNYQPDFTTPTNPLEILSAAIDTALAPTPNEGMGRSILFLTEGVPEEQQPAFQSQIDRAIEAGIRINIGFVNSNNLFTSNQAINLQAGAFQTGGQYFAFSTQEPLPDLEMMFESSRRAYFLEYYSAVNTPGTHSVQVMVNTDQGDIVSQTVTFTADLAPPNPVLLAPPMQIVRAVPTDMDKDLVNLAPTSQTIQVGVEFPDGIQRELSRLELYINGELAAETTAPPFDSITFDLSGYEASTVLNIRLDATDSIGLTGSSAEIPIELVVQIPETGLFSLLGRNVTLIVGGVVILSGAVLFLVLVIAGRIQPRRMGERRRVRKAAKDPVSRPLDKIKSKRNNKPSKEAQDTIMKRISQRLPETRLAWPSRSRPTTDPYGHLVRITEDGEPITETLYPITVTDLTFGSDTKQAVIVLDDPAIEPLHARLRRNEEGGFTLEDSGSTAGTWLNYAPVSDKSQPVTHGDLIHIANIGYRITVNKPNQTRQTVVTPLEEPKESQKET